MTAAQVVSEFLGRCNPAPLAKVEELHRVQLQIAAMADFASAAAEAKRPGFTLTFERLTRKAEALADEVEALHAAVPL